jgi:hypothetical protein
MIKGQRCRALSNTMVTKPRSERIQTAPFNLNDIEDHQGIPMQANQIETLERGHVYFLFRPRIEEESPEKLENVQRLFVVLSPEGLQRYRLLVIGRKQLPEPEQSGREKNWGFVDMVSKDPENVENRFDPQTYITKTRGERHILAARPFGEGVYQIVRHNGHTHFAYALELPRQTGEAQATFNLDEQASYTISIKNPDKGSPLGTGLSQEQQVHFPRLLQEKFRDRRFCEADPPDFLNYEGAEFVLIAAAEDVTEELGITLQKENETATSADIFNDLKMERSVHPLKPLFKGEWQ